MVAPRQLAHVVLKSGQKDVMTEWYRVVLCAKVQHEDAVASFLTFDEEHHRVAIAQMDNAEPPRSRTSGLSHMAFSYADVGGLLDTFDRLRAEDILPCWTVNHGTTASIYYTDPDGNLVELQADNLGSSDQGNEYLRSSRFAENPIGVTFDVENYLARFHAGESPAALTRELALAEGTPVGPPRLAH